MALETLFSDLPAKDANKSAPRAWPFSFFSPHWIRDLATAIVLALVIITFVYQPVKVEGISMTPLLTDQERIFINKFVYTFNPIERGDVVVFRFPQTPNRSFIKRVVGLPGERVEIRQGVVYINGLPLEEGYVSIVNQDARSVNTQRLSAEHFFVLGDRRRRSNDSRHWGAVHRDYIYGKAVFAYWPLGYFGLIDNSATATFGNDPNVPVGANTKE